MTSAWRLLATVGAGFLACATPQRPPAQPVPEETLRVPAPLPAAAAAPGGAAGAPGAASTGDEVPDLAMAPPPGELECVRPLDPELDRESPWGQALARSLDRALPRLRHCSEGLASDDEASVTLRLVYGQDGTPKSQHVVHSNASGCAVTACLMRELGSVRAPKLLVEEAAYDIALVLEKGGAPVRAEEPPDVLAIDDLPTPEASNGDPAQLPAMGCVDPMVAQLSRSRVRDIVSDSYDELKVCYNQALTRNHSAAGNVTFEFIIDRDGAVAVAEARSANLYDCEAINCMLEQFRALSFPPPVGRSVRVIYPIRYVIEQPPVSLR